MVRVKVIAAFVDKSAGVAREVGSEFEVTPERLAELNACGPEQNHVPLVAVVDDGAGAKPKPAAKAKARPKAKKGSK